MKTGHLTGVPLLILLVLALSTTLTAPPVLAGGVIEEPGGTTIDVEPGEEFTLRFKLYWDEPGFNGYFSLGFYWDSPKTDSAGTPSENFTFVSASAYLEDNHDDIPVDWTIGEGASSTDPTKWGYSIVVDYIAGYPHDDNFFVDVVMRASGTGGMSHIPTNNHPIKIISTIDVAESDFTSYTPPDPNVTVRVLGRSVAVAISPSEKSGPPGSTLSYSVTVTNTGTLDDKYDLTISDSENWSATTSLASLTLASGATGEATLSVVVPPDAGEDASITVVVKATSTEDPTVSNSSACDAVASEPTAWPTALAILIVVIVLAGGFTLYSIFKRVQQKRKIRHTFRI